MNLRGTHPGAAPHCIGYFEKKRDHTRSFPEVGVVAAFSRSAFVPGHIVIIYRALPPTDTGTSTGVQRFGLIEWSGAGDRKVPVADR
jgi:hypothetical protein